jgi:hypothetical protein
VPAARKSKRESSSADNLKLLTRSVGMGDSRRQTVLNENRYLIFRYSSAGPAERTLF